ncbi:MAG: Dabb family protein [Ilumatobacteraceae bacterium]
MHVHTVLVNLRDPATLDRCRTAMESMRGRIDGMVDLEVVVNELDDDRACDVALTTTWRDLGAYQRYRTDPVHLEVREVVLGLMESAVTLDHTVEVAE